MSKKLLLLFLVLVTIVVFWLLLSRPKIDAPQTERVAEAQEKIELPAQPSQVEPVEPSQTLSKPRAVDLDLSGFGAVELETQAEPDPRGHCRARA